MCENKGQNKFDTYFCNTFDKDIKDKYDKDVSDVKEQLLLLENNLQLKKNESYVEYYNRLKGSEQLDLSGIQRMLKYWEDIYSYANFKRQWIFIVNGKSNEMIEVLKCERCSKIWGIVGWVFVFVVVILLCSLLPGLFEKMEKIFPFIASCIVAVSVQILTIVIVALKIIRNSKALKILDATILKLKTKVTVTYDELREDLNGLF